MKEFPTSKHQFINASAGTGKTYTIMEIIMDLIENDYQQNLQVKPNFLSKILILTFTEKATGELKKRLREKLQDKIHKKGIFIPNLNYTIYLQNLDLCNISTIHGFCNMVIREYELETLTYEGSNLVPITEKISQAIYTIQHNEWFFELEKEKSNLVTFLHATDFLNSGVQFVNYATAKYLEGRNYSPHWEEFKDFKNDLPKALDHAASQVSELKTSIASFWKQLEELNEANHLDGTKCKKYLRYWSSLKDYFEKFEPKNIKLLIEISEFLSNKNLSRSENKIDIYGLDTLVFSENLLKINHKESISKNFIQESIRITEILKTIFEDSISHLKSQFLGYTIYLVIQILKEELQESKWISYDQMIQIVHESIKSNPSLIESLRERFDVCIVDEFQDTDQKQYEIFRRVFFDDSNETGKSLIVIGDPKQSIYGFRGADMETYFQAHEDLKLYESQKSLRTNYRSVPELVKAYNQVFYKEGDSETELTFFPIHELIPSAQNLIISEKYQIKYEHVESPKDLSIKLDENFKNGPLHFIKLNVKSDEKVGTIRSSWAEFIANEITELVSTDKTFQYVKNNQTKTISYNDIAILVESLKQGYLVQQYLKRKSIPYSYYKERGIYQSQEAHQIQNIFKCLLEPNKPSSYRKLLFSDLFQIHPSDLVYFDEHSIESYEKSIIDKWKNLVRENKFSELFRSIEQDTKILWKEQDFDILWERKITNYRQIFQKLLQYQIKNRSDLTELTRELERMIQEASGEEEQPLFDKETEKDAVQILTLHAAKGLEWPIVFLYPLRGENNKIKNYDAPVWDESLSKRIWKLSLFHSLKDEWKHNTLNEKKRLFYVGITRAQLRLYLPDLELYKKDDLDYKSIIQQRITSIHQSLGEANINEYFTFKEWDSSDDLDDFSKESKSNTIPSDQTPLGRFHFFDVQNSPKSKRLLSYSSLARFSSEMNALLPESNSFQKMDENELIDANDSNSNFKFQKLEQSSLPTGKETGEYLHKLLETIPFSDYQENEKRKFLTKEETTWDRKFLQNFVRFGVYKKNPETKESMKSITNFIKSSIRKDTVEILWNTTHANIPLTDGSHFNLSSLNKNDYISEMLFHFQSIDSNMIKGFVDLVFCKNGLFYIADYKSNQLNDYSERGISLKIQDDTSSYYLQRDLYALVLWNYLRKVYSRQDSLSKFGGVHFFFLRYMKEDSKSGVYSDINTNQKISWTEERFDEIQNDLNLRIEPIVQG